MELRRRFGYSLRPSSARHPDLDVAYCVSQIVFDFEEENEGLVELV